MAGAVFKCRLLTLPCLAAQNASPRRGVGESLKQEEVKTGRMSPSKHLGRLTVEEMERRKNVSTAPGTEESAALVKAGGRLVIVGAESYGFDRWITSGKVMENEGICAALRT